MPITKNYQTHVELSHQYIKGIENEPYALTLWKDNLTGFFKTSADPEDQLAAFQQARRNACVYMNSIAFQGTGFGIFVSNCEIRMTDALMQSLD